MILFNNQPINDDRFSEEILNYGLSIYEVCRVFHGKVIFLDDNLSRLVNSIRKSGVDIDIASIHVKEKLDHLIQLEHIKEGNIRYVLRFTSTGMDEYVYQIPHNYPSEKAYEQGVDTVTLRAIRKNAEIKYINTDLKKITDTIIKEKNVYEVILVDNDECITESSRSNIFFIKNNTLYTAPLPYVLPGTSRKRVLSLCVENHIPVIEEKVHLQELPSFDAAFITGTSPLVLPIRRINDIYFDPHNAILKQVMEYYFKLLNRHI